MYTRASSIRSNYTTTNTSTKTKFMMPQRIVGGNDSLQHYNALRISNDTPVVKNNNIMNGNHNWTKSWPFNQSSVVGNSTVVEWQDKKCVCFSKIYCKGNDHPSCTTAMKRPTTIEQNNKNTLLEPLTANNVKTATIYSHDTTAKHCCCCQGRKSICKDNNIFDSELCRMTTTKSTTNEWEQINLCKPECSANKFKNDEPGDIVVTAAVTNANIADDDDDNDGDDTDFRNEIIRINNIYNNCNANTNNGEAKPNDNFYLHGFNNSCISLGKYKNDINL